MVSSSYPVKRERRGTGTTRAMPSRTAATCSSNSWSLEEKAHCASLRRPGLTDTWGSASRTGPPSPSSSLVAPRRPSANMPSSGLTAGSLGTRQKWTRGWHSAGHHQDHPHPKPSRQSPPGVRGLVPHQPGAPGGEAQRTCCVNAGRQVVAAATIPHRGAEEARTQRCPRRGNRALRGACTSATTAGTVPNTGEPTGLAMPVTAKTSEERSEPAAPGHRINSDGQQVKPRPPAPDCERHFRKGRRRHACRVCSPVRRGERWGGRPRTCSLWPAGRTRRGCPARCACTWCSAGCPGRSRWAP